jgi:hypothetical protein
LVVETNRTAAEEAAGVEAAAASSDTIIRSDNSSLEWKVTSTQRR